MVPINIIGLSNAGNPYFSLCAVHGPSHPLRVCARGVLCATGRAGRAVPPPPRTRPPPWLPHRVPPEVLTPSQFFLKSRLLARCAARGPPRALWSLAVYHVCSTWVIEKGREFSYEYHGYHPRGARSRVPQQPEC